MAGRSAIFPGIVPEIIETGGEVARGGINEISEVMHELGRPRFTDVEYEYDRKGNLIHTRTYSFSALDCLLIVGGPAFIAVFYALMERLATQGGEFRAGENIKDIVGPAGQWLQDRAQKRGGQVGAAAESAWDILSTLWSNRPGPKLL